ncbi:MAG TPA: hypothetical protein VFY13_09835, partial [Luteolibacter sp.]|nr:hypothetical protein [Luteolibacter sp.]
MKFHRYLLFCLLSGAAAAQTGDWLAPFEHLHASAKGTPIVHSINLEPAFTGRDLFVTGRYRHADDVISEEVEMELEWAVTRRLGFILEMPYEVEDERPGPRDNGMGNLAVVPRVVLIEGERMILTAQAEVELPTAKGDHEPGTAVAPGLVGWFDLGHWWTLSSLIAIEHAFDEDASEAVFGVGLIKSFAKDHDGHHHHASASGLNLHFELTGSIGLNGEEDGDAALEGLIGMSFGFCEGFDLRLG